MRGGTPSWWFPPPIIHVDGYEGYEFSALLAALGLYTAAFERWFVGQTGAMDSHRMIVFAHDVDRFLRREDVDD